MRKKVLSVLVMLVALALLTGCQNNQERDHRGDKIQEDLDPGWYPIKN